MGCRTGFYLIMFGNLESLQVYELVLDMCRFILNFEGKIPGASAAKCGNYLEQNLAMAKYYTERYMTALTGDRCLEYPS